MSWNRHRGFGWWCCVSDVKCTITWCYVAFCDPVPALLAAVHPPRRLHPAQGIGIGICCQVFLLDKIRIFRRSPCVTLPHFPALQAFTIYHFVPHLAALGRRSRVRTRFIGQSAQFSNLSTRNVAQSFALMFRADVPETHQRRKTFASKEREKTAFFPCDGIWGAAKNHGVCWLCRQAAGQTAKRRRHTFHHDERKRVMQAQAVTADVTPAHMVKCGGNADQRRRVKWEA